MRQSFRSIPALLAVVLFVVASRPPLSRSSAPGVVGPAAAMVTSACSDTFETGASPLAHVWGQLDGITQPLEGADNVVASALDFGLNTYSYGGTLTHTVVAWDPVALAPDPTIVALRTGAWGLSAYASASFPHDFAYWPPIVCRQLPTVTEPMRSTLALDWSLPAFWTPTATTHYDTAGVATVPPALVYAYGTGHTPLPGRHPVIAHTVCSGDTAVRNLWVVQSVVRADSVTDPTNVDILQVFRVPSPVRVHWVEFAEHPTSIYDVNDVGTLSLVDPADTAQPPAAMPAAMVSSSMPYFTSGLDQWHTHFDFDRTVTLLPGHDYWLLMHTGRSHRFWTRRILPSERNAFSPQVGTIWMRNDSGAAWMHATDCALDFRVIGEPVATDDVPGELVTPGALRLRALGNPARDGAVFAWSGARGALRFEVLDVRGRRVGTGTAPASAAGRWQWAATRPDGGPLPNGVYFVRARDGAGRAATERVVIVR